MIQQFHSGHMSKGNEDRVLMTRYTHSRAAALVPAVKMWKQPKCPSVGKRVKKVGAQLQGGVIQHERGGYPTHLLQHGWTLSTWMDPEHVHGKRRISQRKTSTVWHHYMWNLKKGNL